MVENNAPDGHARPGRKSGFHRLPDGLRDRLLDQPEGTRVTLLQLSTTFCAPCRHTRHVLADMAARAEGLRHVDIDLAHHPEWSTPLGVHTTPTTLALDEDGNELFRFSGVPRRDELAEVLAGQLR